MSLDTKAPTTTTTTTSTDGLPGKKPRKWSSVRRKFSLVIANRHAHSQSAAPPLPDVESQVESFCRPYTQGLPPLPVPPRPPTPESESDIEFRRLTQENSIRNNNIDLLPDPKPYKSRRSKKKKKVDKLVRFIEEPHIIDDAGASQETASEESDVEFITSALDPIRAR